MLAVRINNIVNTRVKSEACWEEFICCCIRRLGNKLVPGKTRALKNTPQHYFDSVLFLSFSMGLTMQGAERAGSGPKGVQMQQTDLPAGYNMFPEGTISFRGQGTAY